MNVLKIINDHSFKLDYKIGKEVGISGADGQVFELLEYPDQVIKLSVLYDNFDLSLEKEFQRIEYVLSFLKKEKPSNYTNIFSFGKLFNSSRMIYGNQEQKYIIHYCIMEKCFRLSDDEVKVFYSVIELFEKQESNVSFVKNKLKNLLNGLSLGLEFNLEKMIDFYNHLCTCMVVQNDLHARNIMRDKYGNYKIIDFDRCSLK